MGGGEWQVQKHNHFSTGVIVKADIPKTFEGIIDKDQQFQFSFSSGPIERRDTLSKIMSVRSERQE